MSVFTVCTKSPSQGHCATCNLRPDTTHGHIGRTEHGCSAQAIQVLPITAVLRAQCASSTAPTPQCCAARPGWPRAAGRSHRAAAGGRAARQGRPRAGRTAPAQRTWRRGHTQARTEPAGGQLRKGARQHACAYSEAETRRQPHLVQAQALGRRDVVAAPRAVVACVQHDTATAGCFLPDVSFRAARHSTLPRSQRAPGAHLAARCCQPPAAAPPWRPAAGAPPQPPAGQRCAAPSARSAKRELGR
jgi:hypothetical protein